MNSLTTFLESDFNTQRDQWEKSLLAELKLTEVGTKASKKLLSGITWPTLSLAANKEVQLTSSEWKKASNTYVTKASEEELLNDLHAGVRSFFFYDIDERSWEIADKVFSNADCKNELDVFHLGIKKFSSTSFRVISHLVSGKVFHDEGAHAIQELALMAKTLIHEMNKTKEIYLGVYVDSLFFQNIAKLRAARLLAHKILEESGSSQKIHIVALTSFTGWTLFERYSNMLRNETAVASSFIGGADFVQSSGYNTLIELETDEGSTEHHERSLRMARNTSHILGLESMLGVVQDAGFGSFHLENLTATFCEEAWKLMQRLLKDEDISSEISEVRINREDMLKTRKSILSGINDYPDVKEELKVGLKNPVCMRPARVFEELRFRMQKLERPEVYIALYGDYGALNARLNFAKNYFELLGLTVHEPGHSITDQNEFKNILASRKEDIIVLCSSDELYPEIAAIASKLPQNDKFLAGKFHLDGYQNIFAGQNIYEILEKIVTNYEGRKS